MRNPSITHRQRLDHEQNGLVGISMSARVAIYKNFWSLASRFALMEPKHRLGPTIYDRFLQGNINPPLLIIVNKCIKNSIFRRLRVILIM